MSEASASKRTAERAARLAIIALGLVVPTLTLVPFGSIWLWQHGYLVYWAVGVLITVTSYSEAMAALASVEPSSTKITSKSG